MKSEKTNIKTEAQTDEIRQADLLVIPPPDSLLNMDCMELMKLLPDDYIDLAIVDPPYGIGMGKWDVKPSDKYFEELFRVSKEQLIWGGNYFNLPHTKGWLCWDKAIADVTGKTNYHKNGMAKFELAWTSFLKNAEMVRFTDIGNVRGFNGVLKVNYKQEKAIHPTQKATELYKWILENYAKPTDKILDTHVGSGSSLVACKELGYNYWGTEIDKEYYEGAKARIEKAFRQYELL